MLEKQEIKDGLETIETIKIVSRTLKSTSIVGLLKVFYDMTFYITIINATSYK